MALPQIISRNTSQKIPSFAINDRVVLQPETWYTCPTGKKAICKGRVQMTGLGAAATANFEVAGVIMYQWANTVAAGDYLQNPRLLSDDDGGQMALFEVELEAGDIIETTQNTGTNAEFNVWMEVQESPA